MLYEFFVDISLTNAERHTPYNNNNNNTIMVILQFRPVRDIVYVCAIYEYTENEPSSNDRNLRYDIIR